MNRKIKFVILFVFSCYIANAQSINDIIREKKNAQGHGEILTGGREDDIYNGVSNLVNNAIREKNRQYKAGNTNLKTVYTIQFDKEVGNITEKAMLPDLAASEQFRKELCRKMENLVRANMKRNNMSSATNIYAGYMKMCRSISISNPLYNSDASSAATENSSIADGFDIPIEGKTSQIQGSIFDTPGARERNREEPANTKPPEMDLSNLDKYTEPKPPKTPGVMSKYKEKIQSLAKNIFLNDNSGADLCDLVYQAFYDEMGFSPARIGMQFNLTEEEKDSIIQFYNNLGEKYAEEANNTLNNYINEWKQSLNTPDWTKVYNSINNPQRFAAILGEISSRNNNQLPLPISSDAVNYFMYLENTNEMITLSKVGDIATFTPLGKTRINDLLAMSRKGFIEKDPNDNISNTILNFFSHNEENPYELKKDGSGSKISVGKESSIGFGTGVYQTISILDIEKIHTPKLKPDDQSKKLYIQTGKTRFNISGELFAELDKAPVSASVDFDENGKLAGASGSLNAEIGSVGGSYSQGDYNINGSLNPGLLSAKGNIGKTNGNTTVGAGLSVGPTIGPLTSGVGGSLSITSFKQDINYMANRLPSDVTKRMYNDFLNNPETQELWLYKDKYNSKLDKMERVPERKMTPEEFEKAKKELIDGLNQREKVEKSTAPKFVEYFKPCNLKKLK